MASTSVEDYGRDVGQALYRALCLQPFPSQDVERHTKPEIEFGNSPELLLAPVTLCRKSGETCFIEPSVNSCRISFTFRDGDCMDGILSSAFFKFLMLRAEDLPILRRAPVTGHDISFLVTDVHTRKFHVMAVVQFFVNFAVETPSFLRELKLSVSAQNRTLANDFMRCMSTSAFSNCPPMLD